MKKIFITGSNGFLGKNLFNNLSINNEVFGYKRNQNIIEKLNFFKPNIIINCAAEIYKEELMFDSNVILTNEILKYCLLNKDTELIQIGSSSEYGKKNNPTKECDNFNVSNIYESTKGAATLLCQGYARNYNLPIIIVRPYSVFGRYEKKYRFIPSIIKNILLNENITIYNGNHDFIYIKDFIRGINILLNSNKKIIGDIVNFCSGIQYSNKEVYETACKIFNKKNTNAIFKNEFLRKQDNLCWIGDSSYAKFQYNFKTEYSLEQGIKDIKKEIYGQGTEKIRETLDRYFL